MTPETPCRPAYRPTRRGRSRRLRLAVVAATGALLLAGCGARLSGAAMQAGFLPGSGAASSSQNLANGSDTSTTGGEGAAGASAGAVGTSTGGGATGGTTSGTTSGGTTSGTAGGTGGGSTSGTTGGTSGGGTTGGTAGGGTTAAGVQHCTGNEQPIGIASVGEQSGVAGAVEAPGPQTVSAWAAYMNAHGGLACHQIKYYIEDDGGDPSKNASLTQQMVQQNHVVAFVQNDGALAYTGSLNYLVTNKIPVIGGDGGNQAFYQYPTWFPQTSQGNVAVRADTFAIRSLLTGAQAAHFGFVTCVEASACTNIAKVGPGYAKEAGLTIVFSSTASILNHSNYTSICLNAQKAGVQALILALDGNSTHAFAAACASVNYHPIFGTGESAITGDMATDPNLDGMAIAALAAPWTNNNNPSIALMNQVLASYAPGVTNAGQAHLGWASALTLQAAAQFFPDKATITIQDVLNGLDHIKNNDLGGITTPLTFTAGQNAPQVACYFAIAIHGGKFVAENGARRTCV